MFGKKDKLQELLQSVANLEQQLQEVKTSYAADRAVLDELRGHTAVEDQATAEIRDALCKKLEELNERARQDELDRQNAKIAFQQEMEEKRALLDQELAQRREEEMAALQQRVQTFRACYDHYLSQIQQAVERLNEASLTVGQAAFDKDTDIAAMFGELLGPFPFEKAEPKEEAVSEEAVSDIPSVKRYIAEHPDKAAASESRETGDDRGPASGPGPSGTVYSFMRREDAPAKTAE